MNEHDDFWTWIRRAYREPESTQYTVHNMEVAYQAGRAAQAPAANGDAQTDECLALDLLEKLFDEWENGVPCYEDSESQGGFLGNAFRLDGDTFKACVALLERRRPRDAAMQRTTDGSAT